MLRGLRGLSAAIAYPQDAFGWLYYPHECNRHSADIPTTYSISFVAEDTRYDYALRVHYWGIGFEGLYSYPVGRRRTLYEITRTQDGQRDFKCHRDIKWPSDVTDLPAHMVLLGAAASIKHKVLTPIADAIRMGQNIRSVFYSDSEQEERIQWLISQLAGDPARWEKAINTIVQMADLGIKSVAVRQTDVPPEVLDRLRSMLNLMSEGEITELSKEAVEQLSRALVFTHSGPNGEDFELPLVAESQGTRTWLATIGPVFDALMYGRVLLVDELELSLHPHLTFALLDLFKTEMFNPRGSQLIFTTHSTELLGKMGSVELAPSEVWFCEKSPAGTSELYCLDQFENRAAFNDQKRYLTGRYGALPSVDFSKIHYALT